MYTFKRGENTTLFLLIWIVAKCICAIMCSTQLLYFTLFTISYRFLTKRQNTLKWKIWHKSKIPPPLNYNTLYYIFSERCKFLNRKFVYFWYISWTISIANKLMLTYQVMNGPVFFKYYLFDYLWCLALIFRKLEIPQPKICLSLIK